MLLLILTEASLFAVMIAAYFYIRFKTVSWPPDGLPDPKVVTPLLLTLLLVTTSAPVYLAERAIRRGEQRTCRLGLLAVTVISLVYAILQFLELRSDWSSLPATRDTYASLYFTLTGAHLAHVAAGVLLAAWVTMRAFAGAYASDRNAAVQVTALYWHFVNVLAAVIFVVVYLSPVL
jgi:heme/copper-type cytochrome/quinol oxidase subunit 3